MRPATLLLSLVLGACAQVPEASDAPPSCRTTDETIAVCEAGGFESPWFAFDARCAATVRRLSIGDYPCDEECLDRLDCEPVPPLTCCR